MARCGNHPETPGVGICMRCRAVVCATCCTRLQGINHCPRCLDALARPRRVRRPSTGSRMLALVLLTVLVAALGGIFWLAQGSLAP